MEFKHISVLLNESVDSLLVSDSGIYADGTLGGGGHSYEILSRSKTCSLIGIDRDREAIEAAKKRLNKYGERVTFVNRNFCEIKNILREQGIDKIDGAVLDLGVSSYQLDNSERGFSYMSNARLDMRMDTSGGKTAYDVVNSYSRDELAEIFFAYGEEKWSRRIAEFIVRARSEKQVETTFELVDIIKAAIPKKARLDGGHPAKRVFQAIRIEVNNELNMLEDAVKDFVSCLKSGGRLAIITFHSLEDRIVKKAYKDLAQGCTCPKEFPVCVCGKVPEIKIISKKPVLPSENELGENSRAKSAKLRVAEKI